MDIHLLAENWVVAQEGSAESRDLDGVNWPSIEQVMDLGSFPPESDEQPGLLWELITSVYLLKPNDETLIMLGAGPLEDLVTYWGGSHIDKIRRFVEMNSDFKIVMRNVWFSSKEAELYSDIDVHSKFYELAEIEPNFK